MELLFDTVEAFYLISIFVEICNILDESYNFQAVCFCGAQFSLQALIGVPLWICQHCDQWTNAIETNTM